MLQSFKSSLYSKITNAGHHSYLLAVSGGLDSMVMLDLFIRANLTFAVAHIDHQSRGGQSTKDAEFVENYCASKGIRFYSAIFDKEQAVDRNFQSAAREFRYTYFKKISLQHGYNYVCTAHHKNDKLETLLINLGRSAGLAGLSTLPYISNDHKLRPLLPFTRLQLEHYAETHQVPYVHDSSNDEDAYERNRLRHHVIPELLKIYPHYLSAASTSSDHLLAEHKLLTYYLQKDKLMSTDGSVSRIDVTMLNQRPEPQTVLYKLVAAMGFSFSDCGDMLESTQVGSYFLSSTYEAIHQKDHLLIRPLGSSIPDWEVKSDQYGTFETDQLTVEVAEEAPPEGLQVVSIPIPKVLLREGITVRNTRPGDSIVLWHMKGKSKKLKKLMVDEKLTRFEKEKVVVITIDKGHIYAVATKTKVHVHTKPTKEAPQCFIQVRFKKS